MGKLINSYDGLMDSFKGKSLYPIYKVINNMGENYENTQSVLKDVFAVEKYDSFGFKITDEVGVGDFMPITEGTEYATSEVREGFSTQADFFEWTNSIEITQTMMEDNKTSDIKRRAGIFGESEPRTRERFRAQMLANGVNGSVTINSKTFSTKSADGVSVFNIAHPDVAGKFTQTNMYSNTLDKDVFGEIVSRMQNVKDEKGDVIGVTPNTVIIPNYHSLKEALFGIVGSDKDPKTSNNEYNYLFGNWQIIVSPMLAQYMDANTYIIADLDFNKTAMGAVWADRLAPSYETYKAEDTRNFKIAGRSRYTAAFHNWRAFAIGGVTGGTTLT